MHVVISVCRLPSIISGGLALAAVACGGEGLIYRIRICSEISVWGI